MNIKILEGKKRLFFILSCVVLIASVNCFAIQHTVENKVNEVSGVSYRTVDEYIFPETLKTENDIIKQYFKPQKSGLDEIKIRLAFNHADLLRSAGGDIRLTLKDENQAIVKSIVVKSEELSNWSYYSFLPEKMLDKNTIYNLSLEQLTGPMVNNDFAKEYSMSWVPFIYSAGEIDIPKENIKCEYNNAIQSYNMDLQYVYKVINWEHLIWLVLTNIISLLVFFLIKRYRIYENIIKNILLCITPIILFVIIELITGNLFFIKASYILLNILLLVFLEFILLVFFRNYKNALYILYTVLPCLALVEYYVYTLRGRSFMLQDIYSVKTATAVMGGYSYDFNVKVAIGLLITILMLSIITQLPYYLCSRLHILRKIGVIVCCVIIGYICLNPGNLQHNGALSFDPWDIESNYRETGYLRTLLAETQYFNQEKPDGYSVGEAKKIVEKFVEKDGERSYPTTKQSPENLIIIMNESWGDFRYIADYNQADSITPYIDRLQENTIKGFLHVPVYGNGTANSEYEVLTGNSTQFIGASTIAYQFYVNTYEQSMVRNLKNQNYSTIAMHPYMATNWNRNNVYSYIGFDKFYSSENWPDSTVELLRWCTSDSSAYKTLIKQYEEKQEKNLFTFLVTMQNHGGFDFEGYESTIDLQYDEEYPQTEQYLSLIKETDIAFQELINYFNDCNEPTMIIMFGDHMPNVEKSFYERLYGKKLEKLSTVENQKRYVTPFIIWTNYDMPSQNNIEMSANYFGSYILDLAGLELTLYDKFLLTLKDEIPVIGTGVIIEKNDIYYEMRDIPKNLYERLNDYKILQYNKIFDRENIVEELYD